MLPNKRLHQFHNRILPCHSPDTWHNEAFPAVPNDPIQDFEHHIRLLFVLRNPRQTSAREIEINIPVRHGMHKACSIRDCATSACGDLRRGWAAADLVAMIRAPDGVKSHIERGTRCFDCRLDVVEYGW